MPYCVKCGVELADSEQSCPLCGTKVLLPEGQQQTAREYPYPKQMEGMRHIDRRYLGALLSLLLLIPVLICLINDFISRTSLTWSVYVLAGAGLLFCIVFLPMLLPLNRFLSLGIDLAAAALLLYLVAVRSGGDWFWHVALPVFGGMLYFFAAWFRKERGLFLSLAFICFAAGLYCSVVEVFLNLHLERLPLVTWSLYPLTSCGIVGLAFLVLSRRKDWQDAIRKRLFI